MENKVALWQGKNRRDNLRRVLDLNKKGLKSDLKSLDSLVIKPNFVNISHPNSSTDKITIDVLLSFLREFYQGKITIAEGSGVGSAEDGFKKYGFLDFSDKYQVKFVDLNNDPQGYKRVFGFDHNLKEKLPLDISKTILEADFIISTALFKTHDSVIITLGLKNILVGALKQKAQFNMPTIHQGPQAINKTLFKLAKLYHPDLTILDGWQIMEGEGPSRGDMVKAQIALGSRNFLAADLIATKLMGFKIDNIGYLKYCQEHWDLDMDDIKIVGEENWQKLIRNLKPHPSYKQQLKWK